LYRNAMQNFLKRLKKLIVPLRFPK